MKLTTRSGKSLHPIGIGTWDIASRFDPDVQGDAYKAAAVYGHEDREIEALRYSLSQGQNHLHCAELYGAFYTDEVIGRATANANREDLFIADTLWKSSVRTGKVRPIVERMLAKLGTNYLDALYIHAPYPHWREAVPQIDQLIEEGIVRYFAVSNFDIAQMEEAQNLSRQPLTFNQVLYNVIDKAGADAAFRDFCAQHDIQIVAYQPLKRQAVATHPMIQEIAKAHHATPSQIALAWLLKMGALPIPKATTKAHINVNLGALKIKLTNQDMQTLERI
ncbi:MAG: Oxidoreductase, aldo/keto reductase family [Patescibacteria group bacterium]|nr:Oxidoreductase, aldo/keto reductase family [Patescibacteria group bacterium]